MANKKDSYLVATDGSQAFATPRRKHKKHNWWKYLITYIAGQLSVFVLLVVGVVVAASSVTTGKVIETFQIADPEKVLTEDYRNKTIFDLVMDLSSSSGEINNLDDLSRIVPKETIRAYLDQFTDKTSSYGITFTEEDYTNLFATDFSEIGTFLSGKISSIAIAPILESVAGMDTSSGILHAILYNDDGTAKTIADMGSLDFNEILMGLKLTDVLGEEGFAPGGSFAFLSGVKDSTFATIGDDLMEVKLYTILGIEEDEPGILGKIGQKTITDLKTSDITEGLILSDVIPDATTGSPIMQVLAPCYVSSIPAGETGMTITQKMDVITIGEVLGGSKSSCSPVLQYLWDEKVNDLSTAVDNMTIGDALGGTKPTKGVLSVLWDKKLDEVADTVDNLTLGQAIGGDKSSQPKMLQALWDTKVNEMGTKVDTLKLSEIMDESVLNSNKILKHLGDSTVNGLGDAINALSFYDVFGDEIFETFDVDSPVYKSGQGVWKYLLTDPTTHKNKAKEYSLVNDMNKLISNMTGNMSSATVQELYEDGLISLSDPSVLSKHILTGYSGMTPIYSTETIGECTMARLIEIIGSAA